MIKESSLEAMRKLEEKGEDDLQAQVIWAWLKRHSDSTRVEISEGTGISINAVSGRINDLMKGKYYGMYVKVSGKAPKGKLGTMVETLAISETLPMEQNEDILSQTELNNIFKKILRANEYQVNLILEACKNRLGLMKNER